MDAEIEQTVEELLAKYEQLAEKIGGLLKREQANLKSGHSLAATVDEKKHLLDKIVAMNQVLRDYGENRVRLTDSVKAKVEHLQNKLMLILKMDRAVEKAYLSASSPAPNDLKLKPVPSRVNRAYVS